MCSNSSLKSLSQLQTEFTWDHHGIGENIYLNDLGQLLFFMSILSAPGARAFSGDFTTNLARQCRAFSRALKIEKLKALLFRGPEGAGAINDWCISIPITILRLPNVDSGRRPIMKMFNFYSGLFVLVHVRISQCDFDDMGCTWNAGYVIHMVSSTSRGKPWK